MNIKISPNLKKYPLLTFTKSIPNNEPKFPITYMRILKKTTSISLRFTFYLKDIIFSIYHIIHSKTNHKLCVTGTCHSANHAKKLIRYSIFRSICNLVYQMYNIYSVMPNHWLNTPQVFQLLMDHLWEEDETYLPFSWKW